ncbi:MAG TPA: Gfo/Idh/MocA family oxidoreductase [Epulopiscium sp.]|nr:Gfo/Idh/MocA family oxidoreductase [Candidatus Epulonipiscium sp.]
MGRKIRFGIIGAGRIAQKFAKGIGFVEDAQLVAIASRSLESANTFGDLFSIEKRYGSYEELAKDADVDVVYIATPNGLHKEHTILCLKNKKAVICEKPFGASKAEVEEMIRVAKDKGVFLMEAMWTRFIPVVKAVKELIEQGVIGNVKMIKGDFGFKSKSNYDDIRFNKALAGGSLMDVGIYPVSFASMIYKAQPTNIKAIAHIGQTGIDEQTAMVFGYENGQMALLSCAITTQTPQNIYIIGENGHIHIPDAWYAQKAILKLHDSDERVIDLPIEGNGYNYEVQEVVSCLQNGQLESDTIPLQETLEIIDTLDKIKVTI